MAEAGNGGQAPVGPTAERAEQLRLALVSQIANDAKQLLGLIGFAVDDATLLQAATVQLAAQGELLQQIIPTLTGMQRSQFPIFLVQFKRPGASLISMLGAPASKEFAVGGPKRLNQDSAPGEIASTVAALGFLVNPALRVVVSMLGLQMGFHQAPPPGQRIRGRS